MARSRILAVGLTALVLLLTSCGDDVPAPPPSDPPSEGASASTAPSDEPAPPPSETASATATPSAEPGAPTPVAVPFAGGFSWRIAVAPDGETALMAHSDGFFPQTRDSTIYQLTRGPDGGWADPVEVPFVDETTSDIDPVFSTDGSRVWFSSIRPVDGAPRDDVDVWYVDRAADGSWGEPVNAPGINSADDDLYPSLGPDGAIYVGSDRGGQGFDLWAAPPATDGGFGSAAPLPPPVTTSSWEFNPAWSPDGSTLVFTSLNRPGGSGAGDLYRTRLVDGTWTEPEPVEQVNTAADEYHPSFSPDGATLFFVRGGDLMAVPWSG